MVETGTILQNRYLIEKQIGEGGMGAVYAAIDQKFESRVAIKETFYNDDELRAAFEREARLLNSLHHPVLPHVSDFFTESNKYFLVMEYIDGEDLSEVLRREGAFPVKDVLRWTDSLLDALDYLHSQEPPIIHRDIKPQNLKLTPRGDVVLLDFGLAKLNSADTTGVKSVFGYSRKYSPLEQIQGTGTDARSDIFSLGATIYHLLTGKPPLDAIARASAIVAGKPDPLPLVSELNAEVPLTVAQILHTALALNAELRFASAKAARVALEHALNADSIENAETLPEEIAAVVEANNQPQTSAAAENFPALEAFAAESENSPEIIADNSAPVQISIPPIESPTQQTNAVDEATRVKRRSNSSLVTILASLAALLVWGSLAFHLFGGAAKSSVEPPVEENVSTTPVVATEPKPAEKTVEKPAENSPEIDSTAPAPEISDSVSPENSVEIKPKISASETIAEAKKPARKIEETRNEKIETRAVEKEPERAAVETTPRVIVVGRSQQSATKGKTPKRETEEIRPRVVQDAPISSIEKIMTGGNAAPNRRQREQMSAAEKEALRRQRINDILRRNRQQVPQN